MFTEVVGIWRTLQKTQTPSLSLFVFVRVTQLRCFFFEIKTNYDASDASWRIWRIWRILTHPNASCGMLTHLMVYRTTVSLDSYFVTSFEGIYTRKPATAACRAAPGLKDNNCRATVFAFYSDQHSVSIVSELCQNYVRIMSELCQDYVRIMSGLCQNSLRIQDFLR